MHWLSTGLSVVFAAAILLMLGGISGCTPSSDPTPSSSGNGLLATEREFRDKITELRMERDKVERAIERLKIKKQESVDFLVKKGVKSMADVADDPDLRYAVRNLKGWNDEIASLQKDAASYTEAIGSIAAMLEQLERDRIRDSVALGEEEFLELRKIVVDLNERLGMDRPTLLEDDALNELLKSELQSKPPESGDR